MASSSLLSRLWKKRPLQSVSTNRPFVEIHAQETVASDNNIFKFLSDCLSQKETALPYINEMRQGIYSGLIHEFDQYTTLRLKPGGPDRIGLENFFNELARDNACNIILWIGENTYCTIGGQHDAPFRKTIGDMLRKDAAKNNLKTVVILISCNQNKSAITLNTERNTKKPFIENATHYSQKPVFLGFNGQVHSYKSDLYVCNNFIKDEDFPMRLCVNKKTFRSNDKNSQTLKYLQESTLNNSIKLQGYSSIFERTNSTTPPASERLKCCQTMIKEYPRHFVEAFKGNRDCIKVTKEKLDARIKNILSKYDSNEINDKDSTIRGYDPTEEFDGIFCKSKEDNPNPCGIVNDITDPELIRKANSYIRLIPEERKKWGDFLNQIQNGSNEFVRQKFDEVFTPLSDEKKREYVNVKNKHGQTVLFYILANRSIENKMELINLLLHYGATLENINFAEERSNPLAYGESIASLLLGKDFKNDNIIKEFLLTVDINILNDCVLKERRKELKTATTNFERGKFSDADNRFKKTMGTMVKGFVNRFMKEPAKKTKALQIFEIVGRNNNIDFTEILSNKRDEERTVENDYKILEVLRKKENGTSIFDKISLAIKNIEQGKNQNMFTSPTVTATNANATVSNTSANASATVSNTSGNASATKEGGRRRRQHKTKKNRRNRHKATRKH